MRTPFDPALNDIAKSFKLLDSFPDPEGIFGDFLTGKSTDDYRRISIMPGGRMLGVRYYLNGRNRYVAYGPANRQTDLLRFSDMVTMRLWKYSPRCRHRDVADSDLNFPVEWIAQDIEFFQDVRPDIISKINEIERHLIDRGIIKDQSVTDPEAARSPRKRKTIRTAFDSFVEAQRNLDSMKHQEILDMLGVLSDRIGELENILRAPAVSQQSLNPKPPGPTTPEWLAPPADFGVELSTDPQITWRRLRIYERFKPGDEIQDGGGNWVPVSENQIGVQVKSGDKARRRYA